MDTYILTPELMTDLVDISVEIVNKYYDRISIDDDKNKDYFKLSETKRRSKASSKHILGLVLGYSWKSAYNAYQKKTISRKAFDQLKIRIELLRKNSENGDYEINNFITKTEVVIDRIEARLFNIELSEKNSSNPKGILSLFEETTYFIYERFMESIGRKVLTFGKYDNGKIPVTIKTAEEGMHPWEGFCSTDYSNDFLYIQTYNSYQRRSLLTNYLIRINSKSSSIDLCIGHMSFVSRANNNVVTKNVVLRKNEIEDTSALEFSLKDEEAQVKTINAVGEEIFVFLQKRGQNRLSSPHSRIITSPNLLKEWINDNKSQKRESRNRNLEGKYSIYYLKNDLEESSLTEDTLKIYEEQWDAEIVAEYNHDVEPKKPQKWEGKVSYSPVTRAMFITLEGPKKNSYLGNISSIFLILNLPSGERDFDVLIGIVSGIKDSYEGSIAMMVVAVKNKEPNEEEIETIKLFLKGFALQGSVLPPTMPVGRIDDLKICLKNKS